MKTSYIGGQWRPGSDGYRNINPSDTSDVVDEFSQADESLALEAIDAAYQAFTTGQVLGVQARADALDRVGTELLARKEELGELLSREEGKTRAEGIGEVARAGQIFKFFAGEVLRVRGEHLESVRPGLSVDITREPVGVVGIIAPWNFPIAIPAWKIAPALAYGNCVVFKPAELVPSSAWALSEIISRAGFPAGVFNLVIGRGSVVGKALLESPKVHAISFTGSTGTGARVMATAGARFAKLQLEMGGKNPLLVTDDADMETALTCAIQGSFYSTGQRCTASSRIIVTHGIYSRFRDALVERLSHLRVGHALSADTHIGPVVDSEQLQTDLEYIRIGREEGATLAFGGERIKRDTDGFFLSPALFADVTSGMRIAREEIFGPVACLIPARDFDDALQIANDTEFGLSAGICTTSLQYATRFKREAQAGMVMVNVPTAGVDYHVPFGGRKGSSYGSREQGSYAAEFFTTVKTAYNG
ncbi:MULTISPECIES: aldehyde dehydrogenase family protein [Burkholderia]|jgi:acyl-CoA reductase-like NAD-dependent aldehyde dehydrogenase|uniref:Aldehyde dehydrogenase family protein n=2 Tax=Burkholderia contaminans TaxID=488447 RepID=A0A1E3FHY3_9BURK|nr:MULTISPECIES: aldehyde dehydrogenase family protein [Burkholderia]UTP24286.1 aldehyde dehydrogenase family protein [Burkholderia sp. FXe9]KKL31863.1 aldehyde dehydrogenase [Burkholderia contaminans LMG 23361]MBA9830134.1 aldehyde dehydrogenase family protein [Burkholderia contaminans]MBA9839675.1 aldehyde dehydrogenase family protein [Burkholderia contaminans]MBA9862747.1 aldehyde dehydrogenase family protein [Burkholderia contaminans]